MVGAKKASGTGLVSAETSPDLSGSLILCTYDNSNVSRRANQSQLVRDSLVCAPACFNQAKLWRDAIWIRSIRDEEFPPCGTIRHDLSLTFPLLVWGLFEKLRTPAPRCRLTT